MLYASHNPTHIFYNISRTIARVLYNQPKRLIIIIAMAGNGREQGLKHHSKAVAEYLAQLPEHVDAALHDIADPTVQLSLEAIAKRHMLTREEIEQMLRDPEVIARCNAYAFRYYPKIFPVFAKCLLQQIQAGNAKAMELYARTMGMVRQRIDLRIGRNELAEVEDNIRRILERAEKESLIPKARECFDASSIAVSE